MDTVVISGLVDDPTEDSVGCGGLSHFVVRVEDLHATGRAADRPRDRGGGAGVARRLRRLLDVVGL
jgi:hypothetical protein